MGEPRPLLVVGESAMKTFGGLDLGSGPSTRIQTRTDVRFIVVRSLTANVSSRVTAPTSSKNRSSSRRNTGYAEPCDFIWRNTNNTSHSRPPGAPILHSTKPRTQPDT